MALRHNVLTPLTLSLMHGAVMEEVILRCFSVLLGEIVLFMLSCSGSFRTGTDLRSNMKAIFLVMQIQESSLLQRGSSNWACVQLYLLHGCR